MTPQETLSAFFQSCANGDLKEVQYYLTNKKVNSDINAFSDKALRISIEFGHLDLVKFLLLSPKLKQHAIIKDDSLFKEACHYGHIDIIDFSLNTPELNRRANLEASISNGILIASKSGQLAVVQYFIESVNSKYGFNLTNTFDRVLEISFFGGHDHITQYINSINLKKDLENELSSSSHLNNNKLKI